MKMSEKKRYTYLKSSKVERAFTGKAIELPKHINTDEITSIISRGCKSTNFIKRFKNLESYTPSPSKDSRNKNDRISDQHNLFGEPNIKNNDSFNFQKLSSKLIQLKEKNDELKDKIKELENTHKIQIVTLKRENEKLMKNIRLLKKEHSEDKLRLDDIIFDLKKEAKMYKEDLENIIKEFSKIIEKIALENAKEEFNCLVMPLLPKLSTKIANCVFSEPEQFISTAGFAYANELNDSIEIITTVTKEAIVMKSYSPQAYGELELKLGDRVVIIKSDSYMWLGRIQEKVGLFPSTYVMLD
ncbi:hypothetical protein SteCoe_36666 [Stentor coeruleus]|uniref:SH3 domain-containing protein n=1 Tax=Stentor coeruleus TaxID=5963 RepID=A0A1R2APN3_9CILI|nr:hypothetical protein SteCoe_36666 [Stentor coeruleus]